MLKTIILLLLAIVVVPVTAFYLDTPLAPAKWELLKTALYMMLAVALLCFVVSELTGNCSQVDKLWSIVPLAYAWYFAYADGFGARTVLMATLVSVWGIRLTYNFSRRGAYRLKFWEGEEDYRWEVLRQTPLLNGRWRWRLFNLGFISLYQNALILLFNLPILFAVGSNQPLGWADALLACLFVGFVLVETIADQQQYDFQTEKHRRKNAGEDLGEYAHGFVRSGLWARVRHPNYASEQAIWLCYYFLGVVATGQWINWTLTGSLLLMVLFQGSSDFSENISAGKYPAYRDYQKQVGRFLPKFW